MRSQLQIDASRRNSQKSTGPRTPAGKAIASRNSLQSGIFAESEIIHDETATDLQALAAEYVARFAPDAPEQRCLIDILVHSEWTLRRLRRAEAQLWGRMIETSEPTGDYPNLFPLGRAVNYNESRVFGRLQRRISATQQNYQHALKDLQRLQADRHKEQPPAEIQPAAAAPPARVPLGFVLSPVPVPAPDAQDVPAPDIALPGNTSYL